MSLHLDSWPWKIAIVLAIVAAREFVRLVSPKEATANAGEVGENTKWLIETLDSAAIAIGLVLFVIQPFLLQAFYIPSGSMEDTLRIKDRLLVSKLIYRLHEPRFQDVVVFKAPPEANASHELNSPAGEETDFIKRCIGVPGDIIYARNRHYFHNGQEVTEPYVKWSPYNIGLRYSYDMKIVDGKVYSREYEAPGVPGLWQTEGQHEVDQERIEKAAPGKVPSGKFLMLGDHRNNSNDSHVWGFVPRDNILGKAICVFWPPTRVGLVDRLSFHPRPPEAPSLQPLAN